MSSTITLKSINTVETGVVDSPNGILGTLSFVAEDPRPASSVIRNLAQIQADYQGSNVTLDTALIFKTSASTITELERMRLSPIGNLLIGSIVDDLTNRLQVTGSVNVTGDVSASGPIRLAGYTVATLPAAGIAGRTAYVTDATAPTYRGALTGGGSVVCPVFDNGTAWVSA